MNISVFLKRYKYYILIFLIVSITGFLLSEAMDYFINPFDNDEKKYINKSNIIDLGFEKNIFPYYSKFNPDKNVGFNLYKRIIKKLFHIDISAKYYENKNDIFNLVKDDKLLVGVVTENNRFEYKDFCNHFLDSGYVKVKGYIIIKKENSELFNRDFRDIRLGVVKNSMWEKKLIKKFPELVYFRTENTEDLVQGLEKGLYDAVIEELSIFERIKMDSTKDIKILKRKIFEYKIYLFTNKKNNVLSGIAKKVIKSLEILTQNNINMHIDSVFWINLYKNRTYYLFSFSIMFILILILLWNKMLRKKIIENTKMLRYELENNKKIKNKLEERERHYIMAQKVGNIGSWERDLKTGELYWSEQIEPMFGYKEGSFDGKYNKFISRVHPDYVDMNINASNECINNGKKYVITFKIILPSGEERWIKEYGDLIKDENGNPLKLIGVSRDITQQKKY